MRKSSVILIASILAALLLSGAALLVNTEKVRHAAARMLLSSMYNRYESRHLGYVLSGKDGWLFYLEELRYLLLQWDRKGNDTVIVDLAAWLAARNIRLVVVPVPTTLETYPEKLLGFSVAEMCPQRNRFLKCLKNAGVTVLNVFPAFMREKPRKGIYFSTDTHPAIGGYEIISDEVVKHLMTLNPELKSEKSRYCTRDSVLKKYEGDLARKNPKGMKGYYVDVPIRMVADTNRYWYTDTTSLDILFFGDSYLATHRQYSAHLTALIAAKLGRPVRLVSSVSGITHSPAKLRQLVERSPQKPLVIVWVFTALSLMDQIESG